MSNENTSLGNSELYANMVAQAQFAAYENSIARQLVTNYDFPANAGKVVQVPIWAAITATNATDGTALTAANTTTTSATITLSEHCVYHRVTDMLRDSAFSNVLTDLGTQSGLSVAESIDSTVFSQFSNFSEAGPGTNVAVTTSTIFKAVAKLRALKLTGPFVCVMNPKQAYWLKKELATNGGSNIPSLSTVGDNVLTRGYIGTVAGVAVYETGLVPITNGIYDSVGAIFAKSALGLAMRGAITLETQRQAAARATDLVLTQVAGAGVLNSTYGLKLTGNANPV